MRTQLPLRPLFAAFGFIAACATGPAPRGEISDPGALIFNGYGSVHVECYRCHAADGSGAFRGPNLKLLVPNLSQWRIWDQIKNGDGVMPAYQNELSEHDMALMIRWMRTGFPGKPTQLASARDSGAPAR